MLVNCIMPKKPVILTQAKNIADKSEVNKLTIKLSKPIMLYNAEVCLRKFALPFAYPNVKASYGNNTFSYIHSATTYPVTLETGLYEVSTMNAALHNVMKANSHFTTVDGSEVYPINFYANPTQNRVSLVIDTGYSVVVPATNFATFIGYTAATYTAGSYNGQNVPQFDRVQTVIVNTDIVNNIELPHAQAVYSHTPTVAAGKVITESATYPNWVSVNNSTIEEISVWFVDQANRPLDIEDTNMTVELTLSLP
ncbi:TPA_asm: penton [Capsaspora MELD virus 1]|nr:TPA_asm: penton [Capsaspora MELD virus 1]